MDARSSLAELLSFNAFNRLQNLQKLGPGMLAVPAGQELASLIEQRALANQQAQQQQIGNANLQAYRGPLQGLGGGAPAAAAMLGSASPEARNAAEAIMQQLLGSRTPQGQAALAGSEQALSASRQAQTQSSESFPLEQRLRNQSLSAGRLDIQKRQLDVDMAQLMLRSPGGQAALAYQFQNGAPPPAGFIPFQNPDTKQIDFRPPDNSPEFNKAHDEVISSEQLSQRAMDYLQLLSDTGPSGTEYFGTAPSRLRESRDAFLSSLRASEQIGGRYSPELEKHWAKLYPDPTSLTENVLGKGSAFVGGVLMFDPEGYRRSLAAPVLQAWDRSRQELAIRYGKHSFIPRTPGVLQPLTEAQRRNIARMGLQ